MIIMGLLSNFLLQSCSPSTNFLYFSIVVFGAVFYYYYHVVASNKQRRIVNFARKFSGPRTLPFVGNMHLFLSREEIMFKLVDYYKQYGPSYRLWIGNELIIVLSNADLFQDVFTNLKLLNKGNAFSSAFSTFFGNGLICSSVDKWRKARKCLQKPFVNNVLPKYVEIMNEKSKYFVRKLETHVDSKQEFDAWQYVSSLTYDLICKTAFDVDIQTQNSQNVEFHVAAAQCLDYVFCKIFQPRFYLEICQLLFHRPVKTILKDTKLVFAELIRKGYIVDKTIVNKQEIFDTNDNGCEQKYDTECKSFIECLKVNDNFSNQDRIDELVTMSTGGSETAAVTLSFLFTMLGIHQNIQDKVYTELYSVFGESDRDVSMEDTKCLIYLQRVIDEVLRMYPLVPFVFREISEDAVIGGITYPAGVTVALNIIGVQSDANHFSNPKAFDPDRFTPEYNEARHRYAYIPFSTGPRNCIAKSYAMVEMKIVAATFLRKYKVKSTVKEQDIKLCSNFVLGSANGFPISICKREKLPSNL